MRYPLLGLIACLPVLATTGKAIAHGSHINFQSTKAIQITAKYDSGTPMKNAQVTVYSPEDPATPWSTGTTNEKGEFIFIPDQNQPGNWEVKVRQSGHGDIISIPVEAATADAETPEKVTENPTVNQASVKNPERFNYTPLQKGLMAGLGVWGCVGTALFFKQKNIKE